LFRWRWKGGGKELTWSKALLDAGRGRRDWFDEKDETATRKKKKESLRRQDKYLPIRRHARCQTLARLRCLEISVPAHLPCRKQHSPPPPSPWLRAVGVRRRRAWNHTTTVLTRHDGRRSTLRQWDDAVGHWGRGRRRCLAGTWGTADLGKGSRRLWEGVSSR
jgi:hypothetical protein